MEDGAKVADYLEGDTDWRGQESFATTETACDTLIKSGLTATSCFLVTSVNRTKCGNPAAIGVHLTTDTAFISIAVVDTALCDSYSWVWIR